MTYFKKIEYYFFLLLKKIRFNLHDKFEKNYNPNFDNSFEYFSISLWKNILNNLNFTNDSVYIDTKVKNQGKPLVLSQARVLLSLVESYKNENSFIKSKWLINLLVKYLLAQRNEEGLYSFNYPFWDRQDEGIATVWTLLSLIKANEILNETKIKQFIDKTTDLMLDKLYTKETSLLHTKGDDYWCLNAASTLAYVLKLLLDIEYNEKYIKAMNNSIELCVKNIADDGHFPYSEKRKGTYILLYHPVVIYTLEMCQESEHLKEKLKKQLQTSLNKAREFLSKQLDKNLYFVEPDVKKYSRYIISNVVSLVALKSHINKSDEDKILNNIFAYMKNNKIFLCINEEMKLYNSSLYNLRDQLGIEVLYWLEMYRAK